jgi:DNA-binding transcriptional LysR family regulator
MTLHQLKIFESIATCLNITEVANRLGVSQPSLSRLIKHLEWEYGPLHHKVGRGIELTARGLHFLQTIRPILLQLNELEREFKKRVPKSERKILAIGATPSPSTILLPRLLKAFKKGHRDVVPLVRTGDSHTLEKLLLRSEIEVGLITNPTHHSQIILEPFRRERVVGIVSRTSPLARKGKITERHIGKIPFIVKTEGRLLRQIKRNGVSFKVAMECDSLQTVLTAVRNGMGVGVMYEDIATPALKNGELRRVDIPTLKDLKISCQLAYRKTTSLSQPASDLLSFLREWKRTID